MIRYASAQKLENKIRLVYSCRTQDDIPFFEELAELEKQNPNFQTNYVIGSGPTDRLKGMNVMVGRVDKASIRQLELPYSSGTFMICGPGIYIQAMRSLLKKNGAARASILSEAFSQGGRHQSESLFRWPANAYTLAAVSFVLSGFLIAATDLNRTLPAADLSNLAIQNPSSPQIDTNTQQPPVIKYVTTTKPAITPKPTTTPKPVVTAPVVIPTPVVAPTPVVTPAPKPTPTPTVTPVTRPRTRVS
jgi:hypothetical protein